MDVVLCIFLRTEKRGRYPQTNNQTNQKKLPQKKRASTDVDIAPKKRKKQENSNEKGNKIQLRQQMPVFPIMVFSTTPLCPPPLAPWLLTSLLPFPRSRGIVLMQPAATMFQKVKDAGGSNPLD